VDYPTSRQNFCGISTGRRWFSGQAEETRENTTWVRENSEIELSDIYGAELNKLDCLD